MIEDHTSRHTIARQLKVAALQGALLLLIVAAIAGLVQGISMAAQCFLQSGLIWLFAWHQAWRRRELNRDVVTAAPFAQLGVANRLTLLRGVLIAGVGGFIFQAPTPLIVWLPALLYSAAAILDRVDGSVARRSGQTSQLGSELDTAFDALGLAVAPLLAAYYGKVHWCYLLVSVAYYLFQGALYLRGRSRPVYAMTPSTLRRTVAGFQMGFVSLALWPMFQPELMRAASIACLLPLLTGFVIDWFTVTGRIRPDLAPLLQSFARLRQMSANVLLPFLRIALAVMLFMLAHVASGSTDSATWQVLLFAHGLQLSALLLGTGMLARLGALTAFLLLAWLLSTENIDSLPIAAICCAVFVAMFGAGRFSLWQADDTWVNRNDG